MKKILFLIGMISLFGLERLSAQNYTLSFSQQYDPTDEKILYVDLYIHTTSGSWNLASANFVVNFDEVNWDYLGRETAFDGPWDDGLNSTLYNDMGSLGISVLSDSCVNVTINPKTVACPPNGVSVPNTPTRIARLKFKNISCGINPGIAWKTGPGTGTINKWNNDCSATNIKANATFQNPGAFSSFSVTTNPVCSDQDITVTISSPLTGYTYLAYKNGDYTTPLGTYTSSVITIAPGIFSNNDKLTVRGFNGTSGDTIVVGCMEIITLNPSITGATMSMDSSVCGMGTYPIRVTSITGGTGLFTLGFDRTGDSVVDTTVNSYTVGSDIDIFVSGTATYDLVSITDANGCVLTGSPIDAVTVTVNPAISGASLPTDFSICNGTSTSISVTITGGTGPFTLDFDDNSLDQGGYISGNPISISPTTTTTYQLLTVTDANGCVLTGSPIDAVTVTVSPGFTIVSGPNNNDTVCQDQIVIYEFDVPANSITISSTPSTAVQSISTSGNLAYLHIDDFSSGTFDLTFTGGACTQNRTGLVFTAALKLDLKVFLNGLNDGSGGMYPGNLEVALQDVYEDGGTNFSANPYSGITSQLPPNIQVPVDQGFTFLIDVIQIELRDQSDPSIIVGTAYAFLNQNGDITAFEHGDGFASFGGNPIGYVTFCGLPAGNYYVVVKHRNHLPIMTQNTIILTSTSLTFVDMTVPAILYGGTFEMFNDVGVAYMWEGNVFDNAGLSDLGEVNATDYFLVSTQNDNNPGPDIYLPEDVNLDGSVDGFDFNMIQNGNNKLYFTDIPNPEL